MKSKGTTTRGEVPIKDEETRKGVITLQLNEEKLRIRTYTQGEGRGGDKQRVTHALGTVDWY